MTRLRLWLAHRIAPYPIMADPYPREDGVFVVMRQDGWTSFVRAKKFRLKHSTRLRSLDYDSTKPADFEPQSDGRFVGTVA